MTSKQVVDRTRSFVTVSSTTEAHASELMERLTALFSPHLRAGEVMPDVAFLATLAVRHLQSANDALDVADRAHEAELSDDPAARAERDAAAVSLRETLSDVRSAITAVGGTAALQALSVSGALPADVRALSRQASGLHKALLDAERVVVNTSRVGLVLDRDATAALLLPEVTRLDSALEHVAQEVAELGLTQTAKDKAIEANDVAFKGVANAMEGLLALAGRADLAVRVRPSARRPGRVAAEDDAEG